MVSGLNETLDISYNCLAKDPALRKCSKHMHHHHLTRVIRTSVGMTTSIVPTIEQGGRNDRKSGGGHTRNSTRKAASQSRGLSPPCPKETLPSLGTFPR